MLFLEFGALVHGEVCYEILVVFFYKGKYKQKKLPILRRTLRRIPKLHTYSETLPETSPAKNHQQNPASSLHLTNRYVALVGTYNHKRAWSSV